MQQNTFVIDKIKEPHVDKNIRVGESVEEINSFLKPFNIYAQKVEMQNGNLFYLLFANEETCLKIAYYGDTITVKKFDKNNFILDCVTNSIFEN